MFFWDERRLGIRLRRARGLMGREEGKIASIATGYESEAGLFEAKANYYYTFENENAEKRRKEKTLCHHAFQKYIRKDTNKTVA